MDVRLRDGTIIRNVPEGTTQEDIEERVGDQSAPASPSKSFDLATFQGFLKDQLKNFASGAAGAAGVVGSTLGGLDNAAANSSGDPRFTAGKSPLSDASQAGIVNALKEHAGIDLTTADEVPGTAGSLLKSIAQFGGGMAVAPGKALTKAGLSVLGGGAGEVGEKAFGPVGRPLSELVAMLLPTFIRGRTPNANRAAKDDIAAVGEQGIRDAGKRADNAAEQFGVRGPVTQGLSGPSSLEAIVEDLTRGKQGAPLQKALTEQLAAAMTKGRGFVESQSDLPLTQDTSNRVGKAWETAVAAPAKARTEATKPFYDAANKKIPNGFIDDLVQSVEDERVARNFNRESARGGQFEKLKSKLEKNQGRFDAESEKIISGLQDQLSMSRDDVINLIKQRDQAASVGGQLTAEKNQAEYGATPVAGMPRVSARHFPERVASADSGAREAFDIARSKALPISEAESNVDRVLGMVRQAKAGDGPLINEVKPNTLEIADLLRDFTTRAREMEAAGKGTKAMGLRAAGGAAMNRAKELSPEFAAAEEAHKQFSGPVDAMKASGMPDMYDVGKPAPQMPTFEKVLTKDADSVRFVANHIGKQDPQAFGAVVKSAWNRALESAKGMDRTPQDAPTSFVEAIAGTETKQKAMLEAVKANAEMQGHANPQAVQDDAKQILDAFRVAGKSRGGMGQADLAATAAEKGQNPLSPAMRAINIVKPLWGPANYIENLISEKTNRKLVEIFMSPNAPELIINMAKRSAPKEFSKAIVSAVAGIAGDSTDDLRKLGYGN